MSKSAAERRGGPKPSLQLCPPPLKGLRTEVASLHAAMVSVEPMLNAPSHRLIRQFQNQLATAAATVVLSGAPGAGATTLLGELGGELGQAPVRSGSPRARLRQVITQQGANSVGAAFLPVRLVDLPRVVTPADLEQRAELTPAHELEVHVLVLAADRLMVTVDLSLVRLLRSRMTQPLILFINRIDCLEDPETDIPAIRTQIEDAISRCPGCIRPQIVFGSLSWAEAAQKDRLSSLPDDSKEALLSLAEVADVDGDDHAPSFVWKLSGVPALVDAIGKTLNDSPLRRMIGKVRRQFRSVLGNLGSDAHEVPSPAETALFAQASSVDEINSRAEALAHRLLNELQRQTSVNSDQFRLRLARLGAQFTDAAVADMTRHLARVDALAHWDVDTFRMRLQLRSACLGFAQSCRALSDRIQRRAAREFALIARDVIGSGHRLAQTEATPGTFVSIRSQDARTPGMEFAAASWSWRPRAGQSRTAQVRDFRTQTQNRVQALLADAQDRQIFAPTEAMRLRLVEFLSDQTQSLIALAVGGASVQGHVNDTRLTGDHGTAGDAG